MTGTRTEEDKELSKNTGGRVFEIERIPVRSKVKMRLGERAEMTLFSDTRSVTVLGDVPEAAIASPLTRAQVLERLSKMGNTSLLLSESDIELTLDEGINLSPAKINALRRAAAEAFEYSGREPVARCVAERPQKRARKTFKTALYLDGAAFHKSGAAESSDEIAFLPLFSEAFGGIEGVYLPPVIMESELLGVKERLASLKKQGVLYALVGNIGQIALSKELGFIPIGDFRLNVTNSFSADAYRELGVEHLILSPELTLPQARDIGGAVITYGRIPLMITERCFVRDSVGCSSCGRFSLVDRLGERFPIIREWEHRNLILNSRVTYMGDKRAELFSLGLSSHLIFTTESAEEIREVRDKISKGLPLSKAEIRRVGKRVGKAPKKMKRK